MGAAAENAAIPFALNGLVSPLVKAAVGTAWTPTRPLGGWLCTYGKLGARGGVVPTVDREGHVFEAAKALGMIDFSEYLAKGKWNDTHNENVIVGLPTLLEYHDGETDLSKAHRKVGWWTEGHLFDRNDPQSWELFGRHTPTSEDLAKADYYWKLATLLKGTPRNLAMSAHGKMILSKCKGRIIWAKVPQAAVCEMPQNADSALEPLTLAVPIDEAMVGAMPCATCTCPPGACRGLLRKANLGAAPLSPEALETASAGPRPAGDGVERLIRRIMAKYNVSRSAAVRWVTTWSQRRAAQRNHQPDEGREAACP